MKIFLLVLIITAIALFHFLGAGEYFSFAYLKGHLGELTAYYEDRTFLVLLIFGAAYLFLTSLSIPGSIILTILAGALFGTLIGTAFVTVLTTLGATLSFLMSRYLFKDYMSKKFHRQFRSINKNISRDGTMYILGVRFIPISPYVVINTVLGLTDIKLWTFLWTTFVGMLPGNLIYVYAGTQIKKFDELSDIMTPTFLLSLTALGLLPFIVKKIMKTHKHRAIHA